MRLLIADPIDLHPLEELELLGVDIVYEPDLEPEALAAAVQQCTILVVRGTEVSARLIEGAPQLSLIVCAGRGTGRIDVGAASARGVYVANCAGKVAAAVAELVFALMLALDRRLVDATVELRQGRWNRASYRAAPGLQGRRLGIVGLGAVGRRVLERARTFDLEPYGWSRSLTPAKAARLNIHYCATLGELASRVELLTIHVPDGEPTRGLLGRAVLEALPDGATIINTSGADIVDAEALRELVGTKGLRVGLDAYPGDAAQPSRATLEALFASGTVYGTPGIAGATCQAELAISGEVSRIVRAFLTEGEVPNVVNVCRTTPARYAVVLRMLDKVGVLAHALGVLMRHGINIEEITNTVFDGARAGCIKLRVSGRPSEACLREIRAFEEVLYAGVVALPNLA